MNATTMERISANDTCSMQPRNWSRQPYLRDSASNNANFSRLFFYFAANCHRFVYVSGVGDYQSLFDFEYWRRTGGGGGIFPKVQKVHCIQAISFSEVLESVKHQFQKLKYSLGGKIIAVGDILSMFMSFIYSMNRVII